MSDTNEIWIKQLCLHLNKIIGSSTPDLIDFLDRHGEWIAAPRGFHLIKNGSPAGDIYLLVSGRLQAVAGKGESQRVVGDIPPGELIGEMSFFTGEPRSADVYALRDSVILKLEKPVFDKLVARHPTLMNAIVCQLIGRLRKSVDSSPLTRAIHTVAIIPASINSPVFEFTDQLASALGNYTTVKCIKRDQLDNISGTGLGNSSTSMPGRVSEWLEEQHNRYPCILYVGDQRSISWSKECVARADLIIIVADFNEKSTAEFAKEVLDEETNSITKPASILVLLHEASVKIPRKTSNWLEHIKTQHYFHARKDDTICYGRLARFITERTIGLTLSGGGAKGFAHIGVVRAFREAGLPIDVIGGTSMGAFIGGMVALEYDETTMVNSCIDTFIKLNPFSKYTLPIISVLRHGIFDKSTERVYGDLDIEDCWINYFCMASNLSNAKEVILRRGSLHKAVLASMAMPGTIAPIIHSEGVLVDGGMLNNLPADIMQGHAHHIVSVDVTTERKITMNEDKFPSPWRVLSQKILGPKNQAKVPKIMDIVMRSALLASAQHESRIRECSSLYLRPPVGNFRLMDVKRIHEIVDAGYHYTKSMLEEHGDDLIAVK